MCVTMKKEPHQFAYFPLYSNFNASVCMQLPTPRSRPTVLDWHEREAEQKNTPAVSYKEPYMCGASAH